jgi:pyruvate carboxylase
VGPPADVLSQMGDKVAARRIAQRCDIPTIPGTEGPVQNLQEARDFIDRFAQLSLLLDARSFVGASY